MTMVLVSLLSSSITLAHSFLSVGINASKANLLVSWPEAISALTPATAPGTGRFPEYLHLLSQPHFVPDEASQ